MYSTLTMLHIFSLYYKFLEEPLICINSAILHKKSLNSIFYEHFEYPFIAFTLQTLSHMMLYPIDTFPPKLLFK